MKYIALALIIALSGCADKEIVYTPVNVDKEIAVPCKIKQIDAPSFQTKSVNVQNSLFDKTKALISELEQRKGYEAKLIAAVKSCQ